MTNWNERVLELALEEKRVAEANQRMNEQIEKLRALYLTALESQIADNNVRLHDMQAALKADFLEHVRTTGDLDAHSSLTFVHATKQMFDKKEVLQAAEDNGVENVIRTKRELDVRAFKKLLEDGTAEWATMLVEEVPAPYVKLAKLGEYVIAYEAGLLNEESEETS